MYYSANKSLPFNHKQRDKRNSIRLERYIWWIAQESVDIRKKRMLGNKSIDSNILKAASYPLKTEDCYCSPKQISGYLSLESEYISHETIYKEDYGRWKQRPP